MSYKVKNVDFVRCMSPDRPKFPNKALVNIFSRHSNSSSFVIQNYRLHFFHQSLMEKLLVCEIVFDGNLTNFGLCIGFLIFRCSNQMLFIMFHLDTGTLTSPKVEVWYLTSWSQTKNWNFWESFDKSNHCFFLESESWKILENSKIWYYFWLISACKVIFDRNYRFLVFNNGYNRKILAFEGF